MKKHQGFTLIELLVVISIIALLIAILLPALGAARTTARQLQSNTQIRGMHQGMVVFAQENKGFYPGIQSNGENWVAAADNLSPEFGATVQARFAILVEGQYFAPEYALHPAEPNYNIQHEVYDLGSGDPFDIEHYSYAMQSISPENSIAATASTKIKPNQAIYVKQEWQETMNAQAIVLSDRLIEVVGGNFGDPNFYRGVWSIREGDNRWGVVWNDNHTTFEGTPVFQTQYGGISNTNDDLYGRGQTTLGNIQSPSIAIDQNNGGNAFMVSDDSVGLIQ